MSTVSDTPTALVEHPAIRRRQLLTVGDIEAELSRRAAMYRAASAADHRARAEALEAVLSWLEETIR